MPALQTQMVQILEAEMKTIKNMYWFIRHGLRNAFNLWRYCDFSFKDALITEWEVAFFDLDEF